MWYVAPSHIRVVGEGACQQQEERQAQHAMDGERYLTVDIILILQTGGQAEIAPIISCFPSTCPLLPPPSIPLV